MKNHLLLPLIIALLFLVSCSGPPSHPQTCESARVLDTKFEIGEKVVVKCAGKPCIYNTKKPISILTDNPNDPLNVGLRTAGVTKLSTREGEVAERQTGEQFGCLCDCQRGQPCEQEGEICGENQKICDCNCPICDPDLREDCGGIGTVNNDILAEGPEPIMNEDPTLRFIAPASGGLIDDHIAFSVNQINTKTLFGLYSGVAEHVGKGGNYLIVQDQNKNFIAVVGTQDPGKTLFMRSGSFPLLATGGLQNTFIGGKPMIGG